MRLFSFCRKIESLRLWTITFSPFIYFIFVRGLGFISCLGSLSPEESLSRWSLLESSVAWVTDIDIGITHVEVAVTYFHIDIDVAHIDVY